MADPVILCFLIKLFQKKIVDARAERMTLQGTVNKVGISLILLILTASYTWNLYFSTNDPSSVSGLMFGGMIAGFVFALATIFKRTWAPITALYMLYQKVLL